MSQESDPDATSSMMARTYLRREDFPEFQRYVEALAFWENACTGIDANH